ncbi:MAG: N-acetyltransferase [Bacteroidetes bacterium]|nr:MAG: N-acetyltransferase [Bacteroidota bacterium]
MFAVAGCMKASTLRLIQMIIQPILTTRLCLTAATLPMLEAVVSEDWPVLSTILGGVDLAKNWMHFPEALAWMHGYLKESPDEVGWWSAFVLHQADHRLIGTCGFKGAPTPEGTVEIGYEIAPSYQGSGLATEVAAALIDHAFRQEAVQAVIAHTLAQENASVAVLRKLGFQLADEMYDPEDGHIWQWHLNKP